jgi:hypothetical protein
LLVRLAPPDFSPGVGNLADCPGASAAQALAKAELAVADDGAWVGVARVSAAIAPINSVSQRGAIPMDLTSTSRF